MLPVVAIRGVAEFMPYFLNKTNAHAFDEIFPPGLECESPRSRQFPDMASTPKRKKKRPPVLPALQSLPLEARARAESGGGRKPRRPGRTSAVTALTEIDPLAAALSATDRHLGLADELLEEFSADAAPLRAEQYIKRQHAILRRLFDPAKGSILHTPRTQHSIILRLFELCKNVDTEGTGILPAHQFRCILQCVCYWLQSTEISELMPHANSETAIRYDELLVAGRVTLVQKTEAPLLKKVSYKAWLVSG